MTEKYEAPELTLIGKSDDVVLGWRLEIGKSGVPLKRRADLDFRFPTLLENERDADAQDVQHHHGAGQDHL